MMGSLVIGASIVVKGTTTGTVSDYDGNFTLSVPSDGRTLVVSYVGMVSQEVPVAPRVHVKLLSQSQDLDEVIVVAYGTAKKYCVLNLVDSFVIKYYRDLQL
ncbi:MAG: carboxypeptidase-like regulatory domain-containing protein [Bacteroidales bacterium]